MKVSPLLAIILLVVAAIAKCKSSNNGKWSHFKAILLVLLSMCEIFIYI